jgi:hypothetical protein
MPKKGKKKKGPEFETTDEACRPFGFSANDVIITPLGIEVTVIGVKPAPKPEPEDGADGAEPKGEDGEEKEQEKPRGNGTMWALFPGGYQSPLRPKTAQEFEEQGYRRAHEGLHIMRDKAIFEAKR